MRWLTSDLREDAKLFETNPAAISGPTSKHPVHRHDIAVCELATDGSSSTVAVATRQTR
jgi:hypothetical protein